MKQVLIRPSFHDWCDNRLFSEGTSYQGLYREAFSMWKKVAISQGIALDTWDRVPLSEADVFWFLDLPSSYEEFRRIRSQLRPGCKLVLQILETPLISCNAFNARNHKHFDLVVSYENSASTKNRITYRLPNNLRVPKSNLQFQDRKGLVAIQSNRIEGLWAVRQPGLAGLPCFGKLLSGWNCDLRDFVDCNQGELYSERRKFLRTAESFAPDFVDLFGRGWNGEKISWCPLYQNASYRTWRGFSQISKQELCSRYRFTLAFENYRGDRGYISEKIFDALSAGSVPVYLGDQRIQEFVPSDSFVDASKFRNYRDLLVFLTTFPEEKWQAMRDAGQRFIASTDCRAFGNEAFRHSMMEALLSVLK